MLAGLFTLAQRPHDLTLRLSSDTGEVNINTPLLFVCNNPLQLEQLGLGRRRGSGPAPALNNGLMAVLLKHAGSLQLYRLALKIHDYDRAWTLCAALSFLGKADENEKAAEKLAALLQSGKRPKRRDKAAESNGDSGDAGDGPVEPAAPSEA